MAIKIEKTFRVKEPIDQVWNFLSDPCKVASCVPGAEITETVDDRTYQGSIKVQVGPSVTDYKGQVHIERLDAQNHEIELVGKGQDVRGKGSASMKMTGKLRALPDGSTEVVGISEVSVVGILAQLGARVINEVSNQMFAVFMATFERRLEQERTSETGPATAAALAEPQTIKAIPLVTSALWATVLRFFRHLFGGPAASHK